MASLSFHEENTQVCDAETTQPLSHWESKIIQSMVLKMENMYGMNGNQLWSLKYDHVQRKNL